MCLSDFKTKCQHHAVDCYFIDKFTTENHTKVSLEDNSVFLFSSVFINTHKNTSLLKAPKSYGPIPEQAKGGSSKLNYPAYWCF